MNKTGKEPSPIVIGQPLRLLSTVDPRQTSPYILKKLSLVLSLPAEKAGVF
jgi:hypothetical protein